MHHFISFLNGKIHPLDFLYPFTNYRKSLKTNPIVEGPFNGSPSSSKKLGEHCTFEQPPTIKQSRQLAFNTCESHGTDDRSWGKIDDFSSGSGFSMPGPNRYGCWVLNTQLRPSHASDASKKWGLWNGGPKTIQFIGLVSWGNQWSASAQTSASLQCNHLLTLNYHDVGKALKKIYIFWCFIITSHL